MRMYVREKEKERREILRFRGVDDLSNRLEYFSLSLLLVAQREKILSKT